ncbi:cytochrome P450 [Rhexocercosporidium sp. MPI-PUGE-AT-0058]|nr:cytochrome P450 [Rhexocercosporidium sp. MPI-PUGE-AT-0058]
MFSLATGPLILALIGTYIIYKAILSLLLTHHNRLAASRLNCLPTPIEPNTLPLGLDHILAALTSIRTKTFLSYLLARSRSTPHLTFSTSILGTPRLFTADIPNIQALLATQFEDFDLGELRRLNAHPFLGKGIFLQDGKEWERSRALIRPQFARAQISDLELEERHFRNLIKAIESIGYGGSDSDGWTSELDLQPLLFNLTLDAATEFLLGKSADSQSIFLKSAGSGADAQAFGEAFDIGNVGLAARAKFQPYPHLFIPKGWRKAIKTCNQYVDTIVAEHLRKRQKKIEKAAESEEKGGYVFLEALANETQDPIELRSQILHLLLAGRDTTASLIGWLLFELVRDQARYKKLRDAIIEEFGTYAECDLESITFAKIKACKYLQYCLNEALRLQTIVPYNFRVANKDTTLPRGGGEDGKSKVFVPKGMMVFYSIHVLHRREDIWGEDVDDFVPERWEGRKLGWEYIPFNGGPRICVGQQYAIIEASYIILRLLQRYDKMENMDPEPEAKYHSTMTSCSANGVKVKLHEA